MGKLLKLRQAYLESSPSPKEPQIVLTAAASSLVVLARTLLHLARADESGGTEAVCVDREVGPFPIRAHFLEIGSRRPLGIGAGPMAILAWQSDAEIEAILPFVEQRLSQYPKVSMTWLRNEINRSRERGYTIFLNMLVDRMGGIGMPIFGADRRPVAAISIAALSDRVSSRTEQLVAMLKREAEIVSNPKQ